MPKEAANIEPDEAGNTVSGTSEGCDLLSYNDNDHPACLWCKIVDANTNLAIDGNQYVQECSPW
jgi:hypothetical protein